MSKYASVPPSRAGTRGYRLLTELAISGHKVRLVTSNSNHLNQGNTTSVIRHRNLAVTVLKSITYRKGESVLRLFSWVVFDVKVILLVLRKLEKPDYIIASSPSLLTFLSGLALSKLLKAKLVLEVRDIWPLTGVEEFFYSRANPLVRVAAAIEKFGYRHCDGIVGLMPGIENHVRSRGIKRTPVTAVGLGIDSADVPEPPPAPARVDNDPLRILYAGSIGKSNAMTTFFQAAEALKDDPRFVFSVAGTGDLEPHYRKRYSGLANLVFLGEVPKDEAAALMKSSDILYFSSRATKVSEYGQSLNKVVEYMVAGRPILGSYSGLLTMINEAESGWVVEAGNVTALVSKLVDIFEMPQSELNRVGRSGFSWIVSNRSYRVLAKKLLKFIESI